MFIFLTVIFLLLLLLVCAYLVLIILMQRASSNSGMGSALGGGAAESALGGGAGNVLTKGTIMGSVLFFVLCFGLYLGFIRHSQSLGAEGKSDVKLLQAAQSELTAEADAAAAKRQQEQAAATKQQGTQPSLVELPSSLSAPAQTETPKTAE